MEYKKGDYIFSFVLDTNGKKKGNLGIIEELYINTVKLVGIENTSSYDMIRPYNDWISIETMLPRENQYVIASNNIHMLIGKVYKKELDIICESDSEIIPKIMKWRPLPKE